MPFIFNPKTAYRNGLFYSVITQSLNTTKIRRAKQSNCAFKTKHINLAQNAPSR